jgi:hypothetical protein
MLKKYKLLINYNITDINKTTTATIYYLRISMQSTFIIIEVHLDV